MTRTRTEDTTTVERLFEHFKRLTGKDMPAATLTLAQAAMQPLGHKLKDEQPAGSTIPAVALKLNCSRDTVYRLIKFGHIRAFRVGQGRGTWRITDADLKDYQDTCCGTGPILRSPTLAAKRRRHLSLAE